MELYPYYIEELKNGTKVGIVGAVTDFVPLWEKAEHLENFEITDAYEGLKNNLGLIKDKCDLTICLYHGGFECDVESGERLSFTKENIAYKICKELDFDILLTGHQHMPIHGINLFGTFAMQLRHNAVEYGYIEVEGKEIRSKVIQPSKTDIEIPKELLEIENEINKWLDEPIGTFKQEIKVQDKLTMALNGSLLANFCNQVQLEFTKADFSCTALGNNLIGFDRNVTIRDIVAAYQFPNTIKVLGVTYEILKLALERAAEYYDVEDGEIKISNKFLKPKITHYNYDFFSGFHYTIDLKRPIGDRITIMDEMDRQKVYTLCMSNYRATGTGEYDFYTKCPIIREYSIDTQELIIDYIKKRKYVEIDNAKYFDIKF
ncbi:MAG: bifunctional metallophosphatase/5'-nucleotidase [Candidatus Epulonipiscioides saccharophilum]|nr:MAG: bifunctional metallophosphatase/5'-nucleotidase [Epulopiscium sp. AS2M-Bin001]